MNKISGWLRQFGSSLVSGFNRFMTGRYGYDKLNMVILTAGFVLLLIGVFVNNVTVDIILTLGSYTLLFWSLFRSFSRNTYKRYQENRRFLCCLQRVKDREHRYYDCPRCRQQIRVPRGKGKIAITCPRCKERFIKKT